MKSKRFPFLARAADLGRRLRLERWTVTAVSASFIGALAVILATTEFRSLALRAASASWAAGAIAEKDYVVERDFPYVDEKATQLRRDAQANLVPPVFALNVMTGPTALEAFDRFSQLLLRQVRQGSSEEKTFLSLQVEFPESISRSDLKLLLASRDLAQTLQHGRDLLDAAFSRGIVDLLAHKDEAVTAGAIEIRRILDGRVQSEEVPFEKVMTRENAAAKMQASIPGGSASASEQRALLLLVGAFAVENVFYDPENTLLHRNRARAEVEPATEKLARGQILVRRGDLVSDATAMKIRALGNYTRTIDINGILGSALLLLLIFSLALYLFSMKSASIVLRRGHILFLLAIGVGYLVVSALVVRFVSAPVWMPVAVMIPTSSLTMLVAILISTPAGVFFSLVAPLALLLLTGMGIQGFLFAFLSGIAATAVVLDAEKRIDLVRAGLLLSLINIIILLILGLLGNYEPRMVLSLLAGGVANGFLCGILTLGFLPIFELMLNVPTRFKLMELSDLNSPIFKRMLSQAPGTYTHSISVANLAETACEAIGANALLARVSAYYHDIGKVDQADYFVENQKTYNRHDEMRPSLSVAVIKSHVRIGIEKARELNLPPAIIDIIAQHHGRGLITYFYHRAVKEGKNPRISRDDYSYPGVRPKTKEAAVLMLADSVEAASRTLKKPTEARLERFVQDLIMEKFTSGELGDSNLTLRDLELIRKSFVHILEGYFHTRVEYPKLAQARGGLQ
ncbi:MAG: HDIG domain-containing metalloprotein [Spirochaetia bacterium]|jgi:putative nucleotidyltransferase with HDIG domain